MRLYDYAASGNCYRVRLLLALLGQGYDRVSVDIFAGETLTDDYAALNPAREVPVLELDDGTVLTESNAIMWFLASGTPYLPDDPLGQAQVVRWLLFEQERVMSGIGGARFRILTNRRPDLVSRRLALATGALETLDAHLAERDYLVGKACSIADLSTFAYTHVADDAGLGLERYQHVTTWLARIESLPGFINDLAPTTAERERHTFPRARLTTRLLRAAGR
jgi:glutathione S-transferase